MSVGQGLRPSHVMTFTPERAAVGTNTRFWVGVNALTAAKAWPIHENQYID